MPFRPPFAVVGEQLVKNKISCRIKLISVILLIYIKPRLSVLGQPLQMASHALDWGDSLNQHHRGGQTKHRGDDVCGGSCVDA